MDLAPWKIMLGLSGLLVIIGIVSHLWTLGPVDIIVGLLFVGMILAAMWIGWRIGRALGT